MTRPIARRQALLGTAGLLALPAVARAQGGWPDRTVRVIVPFPPGGSNDAVARPLAEHLQRKLGQTFVVENKPGAGSTIGASEVIRSPADGNTLLITSSTFSTSAATQKTPYDAAADFVGVSLVATAPLLVLAAPDFPARTLKEAVDYIGANPGKVDYGSAGPGSINHLTAELFAQKAGGLRMVHVPYRGMGPAMTDLLSGTIQLLFTTTSSAAGLLKEGRARLLGWTSETVPASAPKAPTPRESGVDFEAQIWWGLLARAGTPAPILQKLNEAANDALTDGPLARYLANEGAAVVARSQPDFAAFLAADLARWREVATTANIRIE
jgi:tripartite-type tricarboxylate transporter receptor subunit TctC